MKTKYLVEITDPQTHLVNVKFSATRPDTDKLTVFLPSWSPGSYLMREYARHVRTLKVLNEKGEYLNFEQVAKGEWLIDFAGSDTKSDFSEFEVSYQVYCHELTVRTSHIDASHAFLHGPTYLLGIKDTETKSEIEFRFPALWSKLHTGLKEISTDRNRFVYTAESYDDLLDTPVEIGCHKSDGFMAFGKEHHLVWYGKEYPHNLNLKEDIKKIVETVGTHFSSIPYEDYTFITHFKRNLYGGLEHKNSTALHFDGRKLVDREMYINWLALVAHEYFHTWNVKRIRPKELGPFDYQNENYTSMHWLTEGLTSFMDEIFVLRSGLCTLEEYLTMQRKNLGRYFDTPGKKFHSLEQSSFNAWIKLYRPDENSLNSSISYYLKGGLVFSTLHFELKKIGKSINDLLNCLWQRYLDNPAEGMTTEEVLKMIEEVGNREIRDTFEIRISTTEDIDFESYYKEIGLEFVWEEKETPDLGCDFKYQGDRVIVSRVQLDSESYKAGLNAEDEIIGINGVRVLKSDISDLTKICMPGKSYTLQVARLGELIEIEIMMGKKPRSLKEIKVLDEKKALDCFMS